jgi:osmotically-inducible protein OsmY
MGNTARISATLRFLFGSPVFCSDGQGGTLTSLLCGASSRRLTHIAVKRSRLFGKTIWLPLVSVVQATDDGVRLDCSLAGLAAAPNSGDQGPGVVLHQHTVVAAETGSGTLLQVAVQPASGTLTSLVARNLLAGRDTLLCAEEVSVQASGQITVSLTSADLQAKPPYRSDRELQREVDQILFDLGFLHIDLKGMSMRVRAGVLSMQGNISSTLRGELARDQVAGVEGLLAIENRLVGDDTLAASIALALGQDERTRDLPIGVYPQLGVVRLSGSVHSAGQRAAACAIAQAFPGVRAISNDLVVDPAGAMLYVMSAPESGEARDLTPGKFTRHTR